MPFDKRRVVLLPIYLLLGIAVHVAEFGVACHDYRSGEHRTWPHLRDRREPFVVTRHPLSCSGCSKDFKWVSKAEIFKVPGVGWITMSWNKYIALKRGDKESIAEMMSPHRRTRFVLVRQS